MHQFTRRGRGTRLMTRKFSSGSGINARARGGCKARALRDTGHHSCLGLRLHDVTAHKRPKNSSRNCCVNDEARASRAATGEGQVPCGRARPSSCALPYPVLAGVELLTSSYANGNQGGHNRIILRQHRARGALIDDLLDLTAIAKANQCRYWRR